jgi:hypothetical protein
MLFTGLQQRSMKFLINLQAPLSDALVLWGSWISLCPLRSVLFLFCKNNECSDKCIKMSTNEPNFSMNAEGSILIVPTEWSADT